MCGTPDNSPKSPPSMAASAERPGCAESHPKNGHSEPFEELWWTAAPAVLCTLDSSTGGRIPEVIGLRLRSWIAEVTSENPVAALVLAVLDQTYRDLTILRSSCFAYSVMPSDMAQPAIGPRYKRTDRGYALAIGHAQDCVARIACALHGAHGVKVIRAAVEHERALNRRIFAMIEDIR